LLKDKNVGAIEKNRLNNEKNLAEGQVFEGADFVPVGGQAGY
jgi:hypothetical protein